jgi:biotin carboxyl carrier protein
MSRSTERPHPETPASIAATNGREPLDARDVAGDATEPEPEGRAVRVILAPEHGPAAAMIVAPEQARIDGQRLPLTLRWIADDRARLEPGGVDVLFLVVAGTGHAAAEVVRREVLVEGWRVVVEIEPARRAWLRERASRAQGTGARGVASELHAMIPGRVLSIGVAVGDEVDAGQAVMIIEAMKMQNELRVPRAGVVSRIVVAPGGTVERGDLLIVLEPPPPGPTGEAAP